MKNKKGFTLIELLAVLVVLAILALISIPITIRIINNSREESYKRSIVSYGKTFEKVIAMDNLNHSSEDFKPLISYESQVETMYSGNRVKCDLENSSIENGKLNLVGCMVVSKNVSYDQALSVRLSLNNYIYYEGNIKKDVLYNTYSQGQMLNFKGDKYYVLYDSSARQDYVTLLKEYSLNNDEVLEYGLGHINRYIEGRENIPFNYNNYPFAGIAYYTSETCGKINGDWIVSGCKNDYESSEVKYVVDNWANHKFKISDLKEIDSYKARLLTREELVEHFGYGTGASEHKKMISNTTNYYTWTMTPYTEYETYIKNVYYIEYYGESLSNINVNNVIGTIRPVINVYKSAIGE